ncbi:MAG: cyclase family protein [Candidatus Marinimicrobia bacterium]|jgi:kynurenine formamidase|nr:cyclase family protein [Candidatus Neomarinimicrobiota bacterium]
MQLTLIHNEHKFTIDSKQSIDISIPYNFNGEQPNFYDVDKGRLSPLKTDEQSWSVAHGASCNVPEISMNIHCTGTHTESVGHLLKNPGNIGSILTDTFIPTLLVTAEPHKFELYNESYHYPVQNDEVVISFDSIKLQIEKYIDFSPTALIIRTIPNNDNKKSLRFNASPPPFFTNDALQYIAQLGIHHLIVDIPSVDRMSDDGILGNHRIFWGDGKNPQCDVNSDSKKTITEMAFIPNSVEDGIYFVNIQIPHFVCDAAPSRPLLFPILK